MGFDFRFAIARYEILTSGFEVWPSNGWGRFRRKIWSYDNLSWESPVTDLCVRWRKVRFLRTLTSVAIDSMQQNDVAGVAVHQLQRMWLGHEGQTFDRPIVWRTADGEQDTRAPALNGWTQLGLDIGVALESSWPGTVVMADPGDNDMLTLLNHTLPYFTFGMSRLLNMPSAESVSFRPKSDLWI